MLTDKVFEQYVHHWRSYRYDEEAREVMNFTLLYEGPLKSSNSAKPINRYPLRLRFHEQLKTLWAANDFLKKCQIPVEDGQQTNLDRLSINHEHFGVRFAPLVCEDFGLACSLDVHMLRRGIAGGIKQDGLDIDNRLNTLFDSLKMPKSLDEWGLDVPKPTEQPFFCVVEDDRLIDEMKVSTDLLLTPKTNSNQADEEVRLTIRVMTKHSNSPNFWPDIA